MTSENVTSEAVTSEAAASEATQIYQFGLQACQNSPGTLQYDWIESWYMTSEAKK